MLVRTTKLVDHVFSLVTEVVDRHRSSELKLTNRGLIVVFIDKVVKLLHISLMHPKDYSVEVIGRFLNGERKVSQKS